MKKNWYFGILLSAFALLVVIQQQVVVPNQQIIIEFTSDYVTSTEAQSAISLVRQQLESIGVKNTRISIGLKTGTLKISYYSDTDVLDIRNILSEKHNLSIGHIMYDQNDDERNDQFPISKNQTNYKLDVFEIQENANFSTDHTNKYVLKVIQEYDGNSIDYSHSLITSNSTYDIGPIVKVAQKVYSTIAIAIDNTSHKIPEVRAGPIS